MHSDANENHKVLESRKNGYLNVKLGVKNKCFTSKISKL